MTITKRRQRAARKLVLPLIAVGLMATMMFLESSSRAHSSVPPAASAHP